MQKSCAVGGLCVLKAMLCLMTFSVQATVPNSNFQVDINSRENVRNFYHSVYNASNDVAIDWSGDVSTCNAGDSSQAHKDATLRRINFYRAMAGVPAWVTFSASANAKARSAALLASANNALSHYPPASWYCYSSAGAQASSGSNIALGEIGAKAITAYIEDAGSHNLAVGHRRWLLYPQTKVMGTGDVSPQSGFGQKASAIHLFDDQYRQARPETLNDFVSWPPAGFVPYQLVFPRWSFSLAGADFSQATVSITLDAQEIPLEILPISNGYGENTLVWEIDASELKKPDTDQIYQVTIRNILFNRRFRKSYSYQVKVFDPTRQGVDTILSTISGDTQVVSGQANQYRLSTIPGVSQYQVLRAQRSPYHQIATAENGLEQLTVSPSAVSNIASNFTSNSGQQSYYLSHRTGTDQYLRFDQQFLIQSDSSMEFYSRLNCAMPDETARAQVSLDDGASWQDVFTQTGIRFGLRESEFTPQSIDLSAFAGKIIRVRFNFSFKSGWRCSTANSGWYVDDIAFTNVDVLTNSQLTTITRPAFQFSPAQIADYVLAVRGILFNGFGGQWGAAFPVQVVADAEPVVQLPVVNPPASSDIHTVIFKSTDGSTRRCEYTKATLDLTGSLKITLIDTSCLKNPE